MEIKDHWNTPEKQQVKEVNYQVYPNPASKETNISYTLSENSSVSLVIKNLSGINQQIVVDNQMQNSGKYDFNVNIDSFSNGLYFVTLNVNGVEITKKLVIQK